MARLKSYDDQQVIAKATETFWQNGYTNTSMSQLQEAMGINKFSIYSSFGNKQGVFLEVMKCYKNMLSPFIIKLKNSQDGRDAIKRYLYDCLSLYSNNTCSKGCLMTNARAEFSGLKNKIVQQELNQFIEYQKQIFIEKLQDDGYSIDSANKTANFLIIAKQAISGASKVHTKQEIHDYIEMTFDSL